MTDRTDDSWRKEVLAVADNFVSSARREENWRRLLRAAEAQGFIWYKNHFVKIVTKGD